jgi:hypothetical protein
MSALAASLGERPITWFSFGVDSLAGEQLQIVRTAIEQSRLSQLEGIATYIPTKTIVRIPHSDGEVTQWRVDEGNGAGMIESLLHSRGSEQTTVGLSLFDPSDTLANENVMALMPDGSHEQLRVMRGNADKRTVYNYEACDHALKFRVSFPDIEGKESIWGLGNYRAVEFLSLFEDRMCIFAGGGTTVLRGITHAAQTALEQRNGKTTIVLLKGTGGMTDHFIERLDEMFPNRDKGDVSQFLKFTIVDVKSNPNELTRVLEETGRLSS